MEWNEVKVVTATEAVEAVSNLLMEAGAKGVAIDDELDFVNLQDDGFGPGHCHCGGTRSRTSSAISEAQLPSQRRTS